MKPRTTGLTGSQQRYRIRTIFLRRVESYGLREAARLTGITHGTLKRKAEAGELHAYQSNGSWRFTWHQLALIAMKRWTLAEIHDALGADAAKALPPLLSLRTVTVRLPEFIARALEKIAEDNATTFDASLHNALMDFAGSRPDEMEAAIPGFWRAYLFPVDSESPK